MRYTTFEHFLKEESEGILSFPKFLDCVYNTVEESPRTFPQSSPTLEFFALEKTFRYKNDYFDELNFLGLIDRSINWGQNIISGVDWYYLGSKWDNFARNKPDEFWDNFFIEEHHLHNPRSKKLKSITSLGFLTDVDIKILEENL